MNKFEYKFLTGWEGVYGAAYNEVAEYCRGQGWYQGFNYDDTPNLTEKGHEACDEYINNLLKGLRMRLKGESPIDFEDCIIDPPSGGRYGFPAYYNKERDGSMEELMKKKGYPEDDIDFALQHMRMMPK